MKKTICCILTLIIISALLVGCSKDDSETIVIGMELAYPPFETKDDSGNPSGISVDLGYALGEYLGVPVKIENINWDGLIPSLQTDKVDVVISSMTITADRGEVVDFSAPYAKSYLALLVNKNSGISTIDDLNQSGKVIAVRKGTTGYFYANNKLTNATVNSFTSENACVTEVTQGKADAFIYDQLTIYRQNQQLSDTTNAVMIPFQDAEGWGMAVKKGNTELLDKINAFIAKYKEEGGFNKLTEKYLAAEKQVFDDLGFPWFFD